MTRPTPQAVNDMFSDTDRVQAAKERARISPVRARILDLYEEDQSRSLRPVQLVEELSREGWDVNIELVVYHLRRLYDAELVPEPRIGH